MYISSARVEINIYINPSPFSSTIFLLLSDHQHTQSQVAEQSSLSTLNFDLTNFLLLDTNNNNTITSATMSQPHNPQNFVIFGPDANCTLALCDVSMSVYQYRPSLPANAIFLALFALTGLIHMYLGFRWKSWWFAICMMIGCIVEVIGYVGRIQLYQNPWSFGGFLMQIVLITFGPVFYTAAIYVTLSQT